MTELIFPIRLSDFCQRGNHLILQNMLQLRVFLLAPFLNKYNRVVVDNGWYPLNGSERLVSEKKGVGQGGEFQDFDSVSLDQRHPKTIDWNKQFGLKDASCKLKSIELKTLHPFYPWNTHKNWKCPISISLNKNSVSTWRRWWKIMLFLISMMELGLKKNIKLGIVDIGIQSRSSQMVVKSKGILKKWP